jgi:hypothetical protein
MARWIVPGLVAAAGTAVQSDFSSRARVRLSHASSALEGEIAPGLRGVEAADDGPRREMFFFIGSF